MGLLRFAGPFVSVAALTLIAVLPWGLPSEDRFVLPLLPVIAIHYWGLRQPDDLPEWFVFLAGLGLDILTNGPLGYWSLIYLVSYFLGVISIPLGVRGQMTRIVLFLLALAVVTAAAWSISSIYELERADWRPYATGTAYAALASLIILPLLHAFAAGGKMSSQPSLYRGG
jgi:rod shape-determining protein MreD